MIEIDGSRGEGGGQILLTALSLRGNTSTQLRASPLSEPAGSTN